MPRLDLGPEDDLNLSIVFTTRPQERPKHTVDRQGKLRRKGADIVHCSWPIYLNLAAPKPPTALTKDIECVRGVIPACND